MKHIFKSSEPDLKNKFQIDKLDIINKNLLYLTHEVDKCVAILRRMELDEKLKLTTDSYNPEDILQDIPEEKNDLD